MKLTATAEKPRGSDLADVAPAAGLACLGLIALYPIAVACGSAVNLFRAYVIQCGWAWFLAPSLGWSTPSLVVLFAAIVMYQVAKAVHRDNEKDPMPSVFWSVVGTVFGIATGWLVLYIAHLLFPL